VGPTGALFAVLFVWLLTGIVCSWVMARRGHDAFAWGVLGALLGPLVLAPAFVAARGERSANPLVQQVHLGRAGRGPVSVLVGLDGSADSEAAACDVARLFGPQLGRVTLATVVDYDAGERAAYRSGSDADDARGLLEDAALLFGEVEPDTVVLAGRPADALLRYAREHGVDLVALGARGRGLSTAVLGSVAERAVRQHDVPVLVAGMPDVDRTSGRSKKSEVAR